MNKEDLIRNLKYTREKHKNDFVPTFGTNISLIYDDILNWGECEVVAWMHREFPEPYEADRKESEE